jgi:short-subunit dehydrogenase
MSKPAEFRARYGPWALVAGASEGLGAEFARQLAARGLNVLLLARRGELLEQLAAELRAASGVEVVTASVDLGAPDLAARLHELVAGREVGLGVYNAAFSLIGPFLDQDLADKLRIVDVNCRGPLILAHELGTRMAARGRGGLVLMSSLAGTQGSPLVATYAASKAFNLVLAEGLWDELGARGVDVLACRAGATRTPNFVASKPRTAGAPVMEVAPVVREALAALGHAPSLVPGWVNRMAAFFMGRILPRRTAIRIMSNATRKMYAVS